MTPTSSATKQIHPHHIMASKAASTAADKKSDDRIHIQYDKTAFGPHLKLYQQGLSEQYPQFTVTAEEYAMSPLSYRLSTAIFVIQILMTLIFIFGSMAVKHFQIEVHPDNMKYFEDHKFMIVPFMLVLSPVRQLVSKTSAFEVYLNGTYPSHDVVISHGNRSFVLVDELVSSTLTSRFMPNYEAFKQVLDKKGIKKTTKAN
ncbi:hypothetical protein H257_00111 [Aphanomyces astaci]|uniref:Uncharacterized protein n=1 Tax=Aphanomyces astaci TaxID=112090 RepID=W4HBQ7_APHAT|nr:hypothetical protein H257_00111 [Aphanomyces astaci]ETV88543.1 hypothetical protein H257_00111 [Aphanomyces astaci]RQM27384.1 hypothetical protein B5M09_006493 [Aphanomyces astaci]|eukprot:XP_009820943.1 hypothetical protein H257_00111 [Aphanomyces astaci]